MSALYLVSGMLLGYGAFGATMSREYGATLACGIVLAIGNAIYEHHQKTPPLR